MRKLLFGVGLIWFVFVYSVTWWVTFSDALAGCAAALVKENTVGRWRCCVVDFAMVDWVKATDVALSQVDEDEGTSTTMFAADAVRVMGLLGYSQTVWYFRKHPSRRWIGGLCWRCVWCIRWRICGIR